MMKNPIVLMLGACLCVAFVQGSSEGLSRDQTGDHADSSVNGGHEIQPREAVLQVRYPCENPSDHSQCIRVCSLTGKTGGQCKDRNTCICGATASQ